MKLIYGFIGSPGSGKSTQAELFAKYLKTDLLNIGQSLRASKNKEIISIIESGSLAPDKFVEEIIEKELDSLGKQGKVVLDGFFRRKSEVEWLIASEKALDFDVEVVFDIDLGRKEAVKRLSSRGRADDDPKDIIKRLKIFRKQYRQVVKSLRKSGVRIVKVNGEQSVDEVFTELTNKYKKYV